MKKQISIMQPTYIPWLGYFDMIDSVDTFVFLDHVQLVKRSWQTRNRVLAQGNELYLTIPVKKTQHRDDTCLNNAIIDDSQKWRINHLKSIKTAYVKCAYFNPVYSFIVPLIDNDTEILSEFTSNIIKNIAQKIGVSSSFICSSEFGPFEQKKEKMLVSICRQMLAGSYLSARGSAVYIEDLLPGGEFSKNNINLYYQNYLHPVYTQQGKEFLPYLSILDILFNYGFENTMSIIRSGHQKPLTSLEMQGKLLSLNNKRVDADKEPVIV